MAADKFFFFEIVDISDGNTAVVKNYYPANNFVVLQAHSTNGIANIKPGMTITGRSSKYSKTLTEWNYSIPENNMKYDVNYNDYEWQSYIDRVIILDPIYDPNVSNVIVHRIVTDSMYESYSREVLTGIEKNNPFDPNEQKYEILDLQGNESIILDG